MLSERLFEDALVKYPELIEKNLKLVGRQVIYFGKRIDILFEDRFKEKLIVEIKKDNLQRNALSQVMEYEGYILSEKDPSARVMIVANRIPLNLKKAMDHHGIEYKEITHKHLLEFLEKKDDQLLNAITSQKQEEPQSILILRKKVSTQAENQEIIGTVTNVKARKDKKDRFEIWLTRLSENSLPYGKTQNPEGYTIKIMIKEKVFSIGYHNTDSCIWLAARLKRDGYNLTDILKYYEISNRDKVSLTPLGNDTYQLTKLDMRSQMSEIVNYSEMVKRVVKVEQNDSEKPGFSSVFKFPHTDGYIGWMNNRLKTLPTFGYRWKKFYNEIIENQIKPTGNIIPSNWNIGYHTKCIYMIADEDEKVLYIGKSEFPAIVSLLDKMMPKFSEKYPNGQKMNNVPQIWDDILSKGQHIHCFYCYDLSFDPEILKYYLLYEYKDKYGNLPKYNKKDAKTKFLPKVNEIRSSVH